MVDYKLLRLRAKFRDFYNKNLIEDYRALEIKRRKYLKVLVVLIVASVTVLSIIFNLLKLNGEMSEFEGKFFSFLCLIAVTLTTLPSLLLKSAAQNTVMNKIISFFGDMEYGKNRIYDKDIEASDLIGSYTGTSIDDAFCGKYNGVDIKVSEQTLTRHTGKRSVTVFNGVFVLLDFDKKFSGKTLVMDKGRFSLFDKCFIIVFTMLMIFMPVFLDIYERSYWRTFICIFYIIIPGLFFYVKHKKTNKDEVKLEDVVFSKNWGILATDQIEARYLLTTAFMDRMLEVKKRFKGKSIEFSFFDNKLLIAIHTYKDMFETTSLFRSALSYHNIQNVVYQFYSIFSIIDLLKIKGKENEKN